MGRSFVCRTRVLAALLSDGEFACGWPLDTHRIFQGDSKLESAGACQDPSSRVEVRPRPPTLSLKPESLNLEPERQRV